MCVAHTSSHNNNNNIIIVAIRNNNNSNNPREFRQIKYAWRVKKKGPFRWKTNTGRYATCLRAGAVARDLGSANANDSNPPPPSSQSLHFSFPRARRVGGAHTRYRPTPLSSSATSSSSSPPRIAHTATAAAAESFQDAFSGAPCAAAVCHYACERSRLKFSCFRVIISSVVSIPPPSSHTHDSVDRCRYSRRRHSHVNRYIYIFIFGTDAVFGKYFIARVT